MEDPSTPIINQELLRCLKLYQMTAMNSLGGPSNQKINELFSANLMSAAAAAAVANEKNGAPGEKSGSLAPLSTDNSSAAVGHQLVHPVPVMTPRDHSGECMDTVIRGEVVSCFLVGGEKRLCFPQVLKVLQEYELNEINQACINLNIHCSHCSKHQLEILKLTGVLPLSMATCTLITNTDAERLCNFLAQQRQEQYRQGGLTNNSNRKINHNNMTLFTAAKNSLTSSNDDDGENKDDQKQKHKQHGHSKNNNRPSSSSSSIIVCHQCFGGCKGRYYPDKFTSLSSKCIQCDECDEYLSPDKFVAHFHRLRETRTCHWGFDSNRWRSYINLLPECEDVNEYQEILDNMKSRFSRDTTKRSAVDVMQEKNVEKRPRVEPVKIITHTSPDHPLLLQQNNNNNNVNTSNNNNGSTINNIAAATVAANPIQLLLCDPFLAMAYYHLLTTNARLNVGVLPCGVPSAATAAASMPPPLISTAAAAAAVAASAAAANVVTAPQVPLSVEEAAVALLKLAPQACVVDKAVAMHQVDNVSTHSKVVDLSGSPQTHPESFKKHLLNQFTCEQEQKHVKLVAGTTTQQTIDNDDFAGLQLLLELYVKDADGLRRIGDKLRQTRYMHEEKMKNLMAQNRSLHEEINFLRNRQNLTAIASSVLIP